MSCCGADVIVTQGGANPDDDLTYYFNASGISTLTLVQSNVNTFATSNISQFNLPYNYISTSANLQAINLYSSNVNGTSNLASVKVPYGVSGTPFQYSIYPNNPNDSNEYRLMYQHYYNTDSNPVRTLTFAYDFVTAPMVHITPYSVSLAPLIPHITAITSSNVQFEILDITTSLGTADPAWVTAVGQFTDKRVFTDSNNINPVAAGYYNAQLFTFTTPDLDESVPVSFTLLTDITYSAATGSEYVSYISSNASPISLPIGNALFYNALYPPAGAGLTFNNTVTSNISLLANTTYYGFLLISYSGSSCIGFSNLITINYNTTL